MGAAKNWFGSGKDFTEKYAGKGGTYSESDDVGSPRTETKTTMAPSLASKAMDYADREAAKRLLGKEIRGEVVDELGPAPTGDEIKVLHETAKKHADREAAKRVLEEELSKLKAENEKLKAVMGPALRLKVSDKGAVSLYGLGRFPVTLYASQWEKLLGMKGEVERFIEEHKAELSFKE